MNLTLRHIFLISATVKMLLIPVNLQAQYYEYNFGTGKKSYSTQGNSTTFMPQPTAGQERIAVGNQQSGTFALMNPGITDLGNNSELRFRAASASNKTNYFVIYDFAASGNTSFYFKFDMRLGDITGEANVSSGKFDLNIGNGSGFTNHNDAPPQGSQVFAGLRFAFTSGGNINAYYRTSNTNWSSIGGSNFEQGENYTIEILANNTSSSKTVKYHGSNVTINAGKYNLYLNGTCIGTNLSSPGLSTGTNVKDFGFWGYSSSASDTSDRAHIFLDNIIYSNGLGTSINPDSTTWKGSVSSAWMNNSNWTNGIPNSYSNITIPSPCANYPILTDAYECKQLTINSNASFTIASTGALTAYGNTANYGTFNVLSDADGTGSYIDNGHVNGGTNYNFQRYFPTKGYHYISSPVANATATSLAGVNRLYYYNESDTSWNRDIGWVAQSTSGGTLVNARGYACNVTSACTKTFSGVPNTGDINIQATFSTNWWRFWWYSGCDGWNLIGNPYPSPISASDFINHSSNAWLFGTLYYWDDDQSGGSGYDRTTDYATWNLLGATSATGGGSGVLPDGMIAANQAFFVRSYYFSSTLTFTNSMRATNSTTKFYTPEIKINRASTRFSLTNNFKHYNDIIIGFADDATDGIDRLYDGEKMKGHPYIAFYSTYQDKDLSIQGLPSLNGVTRVVPLGIEVKTAGQYTIKLEEKANINDNVKIVLEDKMLNTFTDLTNCKRTYVFKLGPGVYENRFFVHYITMKAPILVGLEEQEIESHLNIYSSENVVYISNPEQNKLSYAIYDLSGKQLLSGNTFESLTHKVIESKGIYMVVAETEDGIKTSQKIIIY